MQVMLILILVDVQYSQNVVSFEKGSNVQNNSPSDSCSPNRKILPQQNFLFPPFDHQFSQRNKAAKRAGKIKVGGGRGGRVGWKNLKKGEGRQYRGSS